MRRSNNGAALVVTVWLIALATILALNFSYASRSDTITTTASLAGHQSRAAAEAGIWRAVYEIEVPLPEEPWPTDGRVSEFKFGSAEVSVIAQDLIGLADLNWASSETLKTIISHALGQPQRAEQIVARILDWRDRDQTELAFGAEDADYRAAGINYEAKDGPFNSREELQLVLGVTFDEYNAIAPFITVHSQKTSINLGVAPDYMVQAMSEFESPDSPTADNELSRRIKQTTTGRKPTRSRSTRFEIFSEATVRGVISRLAASVEINRRRRGGPKVVILAWHETWPFTIPKVEFDAI